MSVYYIPELDVHVVIQSLYFPFNSDITLLPNRSVSL